MSRRASESEFRAQSDELRRLRQQNLISIRKNDKSIEAYRELEKSLISIGEICASNKSEQKYAKMAEKFRELSQTTKDYNDILRECAIEPGQRMENLHNKIDEVILIYESLDKQHKEKKLKFERTKSKYSSSLSRPRSQAKLAQAKAEMDAARENFQKIAQSLSSGIPELLSILPRGLTLASDVITAAQFEHSRGVEQSTKSASALALDGTGIELDQNGVLPLATSSAILAKIKRLKIVQS